MKGSFTKTDYFVSIYFAKLYFRKYQTAVETNHKILKLSQIVFFWLLILEILIKLVLVYSF